MWKASFECTLINVLKLMQDLEIICEIGKTGIIGIISEVFWVLCLTHVLITSTCLFTSFHATKYVNHKTSWKLISFGSRFNHYLLFILPPKTKIQQGQKKGFERKDTPSERIKCINNYATHCGWGKVSEMLFTYTEIIQTFKPIPTKSEIEIWHMRF